MPDVNVLFKKGLLSDLFAADGSIKSGITPVNGAIYFAMNKSDTGEERGKLYLGEDNKLIPIGEDVILRTVSNISSLPTASLHKGEFYYSEQGNILAYSNGTNWAQVNSTARLVANADAVSTTVANNVATISMEVQDQVGTDSNTRNTVQGSFSLTASDNITLGGSNGNITIAAQDTTHTLSAASAGTQTIDSTHSRSLGANINLSSSTSTSVDTVTIKSTSSVVASVNGNGEIELAVDTTGVAAINDFTMGNGAVADDGDSTSTEGFYARAVTTTTAYAGHIDPQISIKNASGATASTIHFVNGTAALDVYSTQAVEDRINSILDAVNAMTYRGSAATMSDITSVSGGLHNGDVFLATNNFTITPASAADSGTAVKPGFLVVVHGGTENNGVITDPTTATYTVIESNDTDTTYSVSGITNGMQFNQEGDAIGSLTISAGTAISVSDSGTTSKVVTVSHGAVTSTTTTNTASTVTYDSNNDGTFNSVTSVTVNSQGHVTGVGITPIKVHNTVLGEVSSSVTAASNTATIGITVGDSDDHSGTASFSLTSSSLDLSTTTTTGQLAINLIWGSF